MGFPIPVRKLEVDFSQGFPRYWHSNDPYKSSLFNTFSMIFPATEEHIISLAREFIPDIEAAGKTELLSATQAFIGQEATHRYVHQQYNAQLARQGYRNLVERAINWRVRVLSRLSRTTRMALIAGFEHFTGLLGDGVLRYPEWLEGVDEPMAAVWRWHAGEENEHKAVAFDLYHFAGGGYWRRILTYIYASLVLLADINWQTALSLAKDRKLLCFSTWRSALCFWLTKPGIFWHILPLWLQYLSPRFHPWQYDNRNLLEAWNIKDDKYLRIVRASVN
jgi:predicted metal-dependent hydrolase